MPAWTRRVGRSTSSMYFFQVDDRSALRLPEDLAGGGVVAHEALEPGVELPDAGDERDQVGLDLGQAGGDAAGVRRRVAGNVVQVGQAIGDRLDDRRLQARHLAQRIEGMQDAADRRLPLRRQGPLQVPPFELLRGGVARRMVLGCLEQSPTAQHGESLIELRLVDGQVPPERGQAGPDLVEAQSRLEHRGLSVCIL
jgi:hypothetical protein